MLFSVFVFALLGSFTPGTDGSPIHAVSEDDTKLDVRFRVQKYVVSGHFPYSR